MVGSCPLDEFVAKIEPGLNESTALSTLDKAFYEEKLKPTLFHVYYNGLKNAGKEVSKGAEEAAEKMWNRLNDAEKCSQLAWWFYECSELTKFDSQRFLFLKKYLDSFKVQVGDSVVNTYVRKMYRLPLGKYIYGSVLESEKGFDEQTYDEFLAGIKGWEISDKDFLVMAAELGKYRCQKNVKMVLKLMKDIYPCLQGQECHWILAPLHMISQRGKKKQLRQAFEIVDEVMKKIEDVELMEVMKKYYDSCKEWL